MYERERGCADSTAAINTDMFMYSIIQYSTLYGEYRLLIDVTQNTLQLHILSGSGASYHAMSCNDRHVGRRIKLSLCVGGHCEI